MSEDWTQKYWWVVVALVAAIAIAVSMATNLSEQPRQAIGASVALGLVAAAFLWAWVSDKEGRWWAIIPCLGALTLVAALATDLLIGTDPSNDWASVGVIGIGAAITGMVVKRLDARMALYVVAAFAIGISVLMSPLAVVWKGVLVVLDVVIAAIVVYRTNADRPMITTPSGWLHPRP